MSRLREVKYLVQRHTERASDLCCPPLHPLSLFPQQGTTLATVESMCLQNRNHHSLNDGLGPVLRGMGRGDLTGPSYYAGRRDRMSTAEEGPEAGTNEVTTKVMWLTLNFPQGLLELFKTIGCCLQGSPSTLWVPVPAREGSCFGCTGRGTQGHRREQPGWHSQGCPVHVVVGRLPTSSTYSTSGEPPTGPAGTGFLGGGQIILETTFLQKAKPAAAASTLNYHL